jgi:diguanylate cyclase (GGDEF)-like protein
MDSESAFPRSVEWTPGESMPPVADHGRESYELNIFHDIAQALTSSLDLDTILRTIMDKMAAYFELATWSLLLIDDRTGELYYEIAVGDGCECLNEIQMKSGQSPARWVIDHDASLVISDIERDDRLQLPDGPDVCPGGTSFVCIPVNRGGKPLGVIQLMAIDMQLYDRNKKLLQTMADYAAIAITNARAVSRIQQLSITDDCTGLFNARHLFTVLNEEVYRSQRFGYEFALLFLDLDHFKRVNDEFGHVAGSHLLSLTGHALREHLRLIDSAFRYGGDEFAILLPQTSKDGAILVGRRLMNLFHSRSWQIGEDASLSLRASVGIAGYPVDARTPEGIVKCADEMMYQVKQSGRDNIAVAGVGVVGIDDPPS